MRAVLDTNVLISGIFWSGSPSKILDAWTDEKFNIVVSEPILAEYSRVLKNFEKRKKRTDGIARSWILYIAQNSILVEVSKEFKICRDPFDDMFLECAVSGRAEYIISGDQDLLEVKEFMSRKVITPSEFLKKLK